jgi:lipopolysaccharide transport system ATP-binding protein
MSLCKAIVAEALSKRYWIGSRQQTEDTLSGAVSAWLRTPLENLRALRRLSDHGAERDGDVIWALRNVSFEIRHGEVVGVVGRNGAGKSTLLKVLSRITEPTSGTARVRGRVASLLEVGTGFHPDLTGRENVYLNGTILGMRKAEIDQKFDEIVEFAGVARFIDTPIKRYSSGMQVRLAFSVAAHLEPEILIIDEVLAVGDVAFQKKCLGKMESVASGGRTILFVSHNMQLIDALCPRSVMLQGGVLVADGRTRDVLAQYHESLRDTPVRLDTEVSNYAYRRGSGAARFSSIGVLDVDDVERYRFQTGETVRFRLAYEVLFEVPCLYVAVLLHSGTTRETLATLRHVVSSTPLAQGDRGVVEVTVPTLPLRAGTYPLYFWLGDSYARAYDVVDDLTLPLSVYAVDSELSAGVVEIDSSLRVMQIRSSASDGDRVSA